MQEKQGVENGRRGAHPGAPVIPADSGNRVTIHCFRVPSALPRRLEKLGVSPSLVLHQAGLPAGLLRQQKILVTTEELFALYRGIAEISRDPAIGLKIGTEERMGRYHPIAIAALCTRSSATPCRGWRATSS